MPVLRNPASEPYAATEVRSRVSYPLVKGTAGPQQPDPVEDMQFVLQSCRQSLWWLSWAVAAVCLATGSEPLAGKAVLLPATPYSTAVSQASLSRLGALLTIALPAIRMIAANRTRKWFSMSFIFCSLQPITITTLMQIKVETLGAPYVARQSFGR
jgi:hypothetical protein